MTAVLCHLESRLACDNVDNKQPGQGPGDSAETLEARQMRFHGGQHGHCGHTRQRQRERRGQCGEADG